MAAVVGQDNWVCSAAGPGGQNNYTEIYCVNPINPATNRFIDVVNATINGVPQSDPNWPTSAPGFTVGIHDVSGGTGPSWLEVTFHNQSWGANGGSVFNLDTNTWSLLTAADIYWSGHVSMGNGKYINSSGSVNGFDSRGMVVRDPNNLMNSSSYLFIDQPFGTPNRWCDADHNSWLNTMINPTAPILSSRYMANTPNCSFAWTGEIVAAAVDGSNTVWRFAHNHTGGCYYGEGFAQISNDGNWALFSSYWDGTLGPDLSFGCQTRIDTFIVNLTNITTPPPAPPVAIATTSLPNATQGSAYSTTLTASGGTSPFKWSVTSGSLPGGLTLASGSGVISGSPTANGTFTFTVLVVDAKAQSANAVVNLTINPPAPPPVTITTSALPSATQGVAYSTTLAASGGTPPYTWSVTSGNLPGGLTLASSTGVVSGNSTANGTFNFTVQVVDANAQNASATLNLFVNPPAPPPVVITTSALQNATQGVAYSAALTASGGTAPFTWSVTSGSLPAGLTLASGSGVISGSSTANGTFNFTVQVVDANAQNASATLSLTVNPSAAPPITLLQAAAQEGSAVGAVTAGFRSNNTAGDLIVAFVRMSTTYQTVAVSDTLGNSYTEAVAQPQTADGHQVHVFYAKNILGGANAVTATFSATNNHPWLAVYEYSGLDTVSPLDQTAKSQGSGPVAGAGPTASISVSNELVFAATGLPASYTGTSTAGTGYALIQQDTGASPAANESALAPAIQAVTGGFTLSSPTSWTAVVATFKPFGAPPPPPPPPSHLVITTSALPGAAQGSAYSATLTASGGRPPYAWSVTAGSLPAALTLASGSGVISGSATAGGTSTFTVQVVDAKAQNVSAVLSITVNPSGLQPITLVQSAATQGSAVTSVSAQFPSANAAGNLIIAFVRMSSTSQTVTVTDTAGNTYTDAVSQVQTVDGHQVHIFYAKNINGGANVVTASFSATNNHPWIALYEYSGLNTTAPLDQTANAQGSSSSASSGATAVTTSSNELVFAATGLPASYTGSVSAGTGYALMQQDTGTSPAANEAATTSSTGSVAGVFSLGSASNWTAVVATFMR
jgi:hypothetical protein